MPALNTDALIDAVHDAAIALPAAAMDWDPVIDLAGDADLVLLGEATHGTHEFYAARADLTMRMIREQGVRAVAVEADWPDAYRVNRYVRGTGPDTDPDEALTSFLRFPRWMWRNTDVVEFIRALREHNEDLPPAERVGFYGLDLYSLYTSVAAVVEFLAQVDPTAAERARGRYACLEPFGENPQTYGYMTSLGLTESCRDEVVAQLIDLQTNAALYARRNGLIAEDELFFAEQNARLVANAERYYRAMFSDAISSWNLRDRHMAETLDALRAHLERGGDRARVVVWEHNSHVGDARATEAGPRGELTVGRLAREAHPKRAVLVGFTTHSGDVAAASAWDGPVLRQRIRPAIEGSVEDLFHRAGLSAAMLPLRDLRGAAAAGLSEPMLHRAIGVVYHPQTERQSHYIVTRLAEQYDAVIHLDQTTAVQPLDGPESWHTVSELPETYPTGL